MHWAGSSLWHWFTFNTALSLQNDENTATPAASKPTTSFLSTSLLDLEVTTISLSGHVPAGSLRSGAISEVEDVVVVVDADGNFYEVTSPTSETVNIRALATSLEINSGPMRKALEKRFPDRTVRPGRVSDLHYSAITGELFAAHTFWYPDRQCLASRISSLTKEKLLQRGVDNTDNWRVRFETRSCLPITNASHVKRRSALADFGSGIPPDVRALRAERARIIR